MGRLLVLHTGAIALHHVVHPLRATDTQLVCISPGHPRGTIDVAVSEGGVHWTHASIFTYYEQPVLTGVKPLAGRTGGGTLLRLIGFSFDSWAVANFTRCRFGHGASALTSPMIGRSDTVLKCITPPGALGPTRVEVSLNSQDYSAALPAASFSFHAEPTISSLMPTGGPVGGGTLLLIKGTGFTPESLVQQGLSKVTCRFGDAFSSHYAHTARAITAEDDSVQCMTPTTLVGSSLHSYSRLPTHPPTYPPTHPPTYSPTYSPTYPPTFPRMHLHIYSLQLPGCSINASLLCPNWKGHRLPGWTQRSGAHQY